MKTQTIKRGIDMQSVGKKIASLRKARSYTQEKLAGMIGVSPQAISKWESDTTMPDIMLLPVIADVFDVTIDELFGKCMQKSQRTIPFDKVTDEAYVALLESMAKSWIHTDESIGSVSQCAEITKKQLRNHPNSHSAILSYQNGGVYANSKLGLVFTQRFEEANGLLEDEDAATYLKMLADPAVRKVLLYLLKDSGATVTAASVAAKCRLTEVEASDALSRLWNCNFATCQPVDMGSETINVYHLFGAHKMLLVYTVLSLAGTLANYQETYYGFRA